MRGYSFEFAGDIGVRTVSGTEYFLERSVLAYRHFSYAEYFPYGKTGWSYVTPLFPMVALGARWGL